MNIASIFFIAVMAKVPSEQAVRTIACMGLDQRSVPATATSRVLTVTKEVVLQAKLNRPVIVCIVPYGRATFPVLIHHSAAGAPFAVVISEEFERDASDEGLRGMMAHEVAHQLVPEPVDSPMGQPMTLEQAIENESAVDQRAAVLVGTSTMISALKDDKRIVAESVRKRLDAAMVELDGRIKRLTENK